MRLDLHRPEENGALIDNATRKSTCVDSAEIAICSKYPALD